MRSTSGSRCPGVGAYALATRRSGFRWASATTSLISPLQNQIRPPVTTIAWRMGHLIVGVFGERNARYFDGPAVSYQSYDYPGTADQALIVLDDQYQRWIDGVRTLGLTHLAERCREPDFSGPSRWQRWSCTFIGRSSITAPRSPSCATSIGSARQPAKSDRWSQMGIVVGVTSTPTSAPTRPGTPLSL